MKRIKTHTAIKLSKKQVEVIRAMREGKGVFKWLGTPSCKFIFNGKTLRYDTAIDLRYKRLIEVHKHIQGDRYYQLTELGKNCNID